MTEKQNPAPVAAGTGQTEGVQGEQYSRRRRRPLDAASPGTASVELLDWWGDLLAGAGPHAAWQDYVCKQGIDLTAAYAFIGILAVTPVAFLPPGRFDFVDDAAADAEMAAVCEVVLGAEAEVVDLCAWSCADPTRFATARGVADALGGDQVENPATYFGGRPLLVHRSPLAWIKSGCRGCVILNRRSAPDWLAPAPGRIAGEDIDHARELARLLRGYVDLERIVAPLKVAA